MRDTGGMNDMTSASAEKLFDVVQIGYGPVGQASALMLGQLGYDVAVFERHPNLFGNSRVGHIDHEIMRILQSLGTASSMAEKSVCPEMYEWRTADGRSLYKFPWLDGISGWRAAYLFYQPDLETTLDSAVRERPNVRVAQGWEATEIAQFPDHVAVTLRERGAGPGISNRRIARAKYLLATDGGNSFVRKALGLQMRDLGYKHGWLVLDFLNKRKIKLDFDNGQICDPRRPTSLFEMGKRHRRFSFAAMPGETEQGLLEPAKAWELVSHWITPDDAELTRQVFYVFEARVLEQMRRGRVFFLGDSAHVMPPSWDRAWAPESATRRIWPGNSIWCSGGFLTTRFWTRIRRSDSRTRSDTPRSPWNSREFFAPSIRMRRDGGTRRYFPASCPP